MGEEKRHGKGYSGRTKARVSNVGGWEGEQDELKMKSICIRHDLIKTIRKLKC